MFELTIQREIDLLLLLSMFDLQALQEHRAVTPQTIARNISRHGYLKWGELNMRAELEQLAEHGRVRRIDERYMLLPAGEGTVFGWARFAAPRKRKLKRCTIASTVRMRELVAMLEAVPPRPIVDESPQGHAHYSVYVVLLAEDILRKDYVLAVNPKRNPDYPSVYVGMTGQTPEVRFYNHKRGHQSGRRWVRRYGIRLLEDLFDFTPMSYDEASREEESCAKRLREDGWTVLAGHLDQSD